MPTETAIKRHPIRGAFWGLLLGIGVSIYLVIFSVVPFGDWVPLIIAVVICVLLGVLWGYFAPAKKPKDWDEQVAQQAEPEPVPAYTAPPEQPTPSPTDTAASEPPPTEPAATATPPTEPPPSEPPAPGAGGGPGEPPAEPEGPQRF